MDLAKKHATAFLGLVVVASLFFHLGYKRGEDVALVLAAQREVSNSEEGKPELVDFAPFWKAWAIINKDYVPTGTITELVSDETRVWGAIEGMVASLGDPYTVFLPPVESKYFAAEIKGSFGGVGMEVGQEGGVITVIAPLKGMPADKAGIKAGDRLIGINGEPTGNITIDEAVAKIRGKGGTAVSLTVVREGEEKPLDIKIVRDRIDIPTANTKIVGDRQDIFVIELYNFSATSANVFRNSLREFLLSGREKLIIDLRGNPGGFLDASVDIASWFLPQGKAIVIEDSGGRKEEKVYRSRGYDIFNEDFKFAILIDQGSASASEIVAGALRDHGKAVLVGNQTFGKGSVQELVKITPETSLKVTVARWFTPNGTSISDSGLTPDYKIDRTREDFEKGFDPQLNKAIEVLSSL